MRVRAACACLALVACGQGSVTPDAGRGYEPEPFTVWDSIAILRGIWLSLNGRLETLVAAEAARTGESMEFNLEEILTAA